MLSAARARYLLGRTTYFDSNDELEGLPEVPESLSDNRHQYNSKHGLVERIFALPLVVR